MTATMASAGPAGLAFPPGVKNGIELFISDADRRFFSNFEMFADALNHRFEPNEPWRVQELPNAELTGRGLRSSLRNLLQ